MCRNDAVAAGTTQSLTGVEYYRTPVDSMTSLIMHAEMWFGGFELRINLHTFLWKDITGCCYYRSVFLQSSQKIYEKGQNNNVIG